MPNEHDIRIEISADAGRAQAALLDFHRDLIRLDYGVADLSDEAADFLIAAERARAEKFMQTLDYRPGARAMGRVVQILSDRLFLLTHGKSWKQASLEIALLYYRPRW